ncbi:unnamed protein product [Discosporangium mesarthrocarpum]
MSIKLGLLGPARYFTDSYNIFDFLITWLGIIEITVQVAGFITGLRIIRIFRVARVVRMTSLGKLSRGRFNPSPQMDLTRIVGILTTSLVWIINIYAVLILLIYMFSVLGMQFFGNAMEDMDVNGNNAIQFNFQNFGKAALTVLDLLAGNQWDLVVFETVESTGQQIGIVFYIIWLVLSRWLVMAMVVSVLFYRVDADTEEYLKVAARSSMRSIFALERAYMQCFKSHIYMKWRKKYEEATGNRVAKGQIKLMEFNEPPANPSWLQKMKSSKHSLLLFNSHNPIRELCEWVTTTPNRFIYDDPTNQQSSTTLLCLLVRLEGCKSHTKMGYRVFFKDHSQCRPMSSSAVDIQASPREKQSWWLRFLGRKRLRHWVHFCFNMLMFFAVVTAAITVALEVEIMSGFRETGDLPAKVWQVEVVITSIFVAEVVIKSIGHGFIYLPGAYLKDGMNIVDFTVTVGSPALTWVGTAGWPGMPSMLENVLKENALRMLRVLRMLRMAGNSKSMMDILRSILAAKRALCLTCLIMLFSWLLWSIVGLQVWAGSFNYCSDPVTAEANGKDDYYVYYDGTSFSGQTECEEAGYEWKNAKWNFDTLGDALHSVFIIFTFNGWHHIMFSAVNARVRALGQNAQAWNNVSAGLFFLCVLLSFVILILLIIGVVHSTFMFLNYTRSGERLSSLKQAFWTMYEAKLAHVQPATVPRKPQEAGVRRVLFNILMSPRWRVILSAGIITNLTIRYLVGLRWENYKDAPQWIHIQA